MRSQVMKQVAIGHKEREIDGKGKTANVTMELKLDDDPETLRAALELIDATMDTQLDVPADHVDAVDAAVDQTSPVPPPVTGRRRRPRDDILLLRQRVAQLQTRLLQLRRQSNRAALEASLLEVTPTTVWKRIALQQMKHRRNAEMENEKLHVLFRSQLMVGQRLLSLLRRADAKHLVPSSQADQTQTVDIQSREEQDRHANELFARVDRVFADEVFQSDHTSFYDVRAHNSGTNESTVDTYAGWVVPCESTEVAETLWANMTQIEGSKVCKSLRMNIEALDDTLLASFCISTAAQAERVYGSCAGTALYRRYRTSDDTVVIVTVMSGKMLGSTSTSHDEDIAAFEEQVMRIRPVQSLGGEVHTQVHISRHIRLTFSAEHSSARQSITTASIELMLLKVEDDITRKQEMVEELLQAH
ncbi:hypothetical protein Poli38472_004927 [Pythium oligandrum]|uniref:Uncharacterized protein n=1 Tax=Pythium oligandrum TaxID=41045 RepID=A0A8K1CBY9_PYTOL|nr:hypothetical protein Poli38472_004927 [Pythium oligandrum]|eukprot:TMW59858.1 hypothetical protein Poli38472_004927 [Pythium oligandrum]